MASSNLAPTAGNVQGLLGRLSDPDPDFRFMSLNDLLNLISSSKPDFLVHEFSVASRMVDAIIKTLDDQNGEVQNLAIKCLGPVTTRVSNNVIAPMIDRLSKLELKQAVDQSIPFVALRTIIAALPRPVPGVVAQAPLDAYNVISRVLIPRLVGTTPQGGDARRSAQPGPGLLVTHHESPEAVDVLVETVRCFGPLLKELEVEALQHALIAVLERDRGSSVVKKRAVVAVSILAPYLTDRLLDVMVAQMVKAMRDPKTSFVTRRMFISIMGSMARSIPERFGRHLGVMFPFIVDILSEEELQRQYELVNEGSGNYQDFNEIGEAALVALDAFLASCGEEMEKHNFLEPAILACKRFLKYDPNSAVDDDDEMDMDEEDDEDDDFDDDDGGFDDDDDDSSWKVRRCAAKALYTLLSMPSDPSRLEHLYRDCAALLVRRFGEREENVRLEVISTASLLVRLSGDGVVFADADDDMEVEVAALRAPLSRKRRRQSSAAGQSAVMTGLASPVLTKAPRSGPKEELAKHVPAIVKASIKLLKGKTLPSKQAVVKLISEIVFTMRGGLSEQLADLMGPVVAVVKSSSSGVVASSLAAAGGSASATPNTLRIAGLKLISDICKTHSSSVLHPYLSKLVLTVVDVVDDKFYKISSEALRTAEELVKTVTPPRSKNAGPRFKDEIAGIYAVAMRCAMASDIDTEVRQRAIHVLGVLLSRTITADGSALLASAMRSEGLKCLAERIKAETTRLEAVRAVDAVLLSVTDPSFIEVGWIGDVTTLLNAQMRKANRSLRGSSIQGLKHLVLSPATAGQLDDETMGSIANGVLPVITHNDTYLLGPAMQILTALVAKRPDIVLKADVRSAIAEIVKTTASANMVLDQILDFVTQVGICSKDGDNAECAQGLMTILLRNVSVRGDPAVVGRVIGALAASSGDRSGVTTESFITELANANKAGDEARVCLALSVLGEMGMRASETSSISPQLFLDMFRLEPDKVSLAAANAAGRAGSTNVSTYLPVLLAATQKGPNVEYLVLLAVKEILCQQASMTPVVRSLADDIWEHLLRGTANVDSKVTCAECVGRLIILEPVEFMGRLRKILHDADPSVRGMVVQAVRYCLPESDLEAVDAVLKDVLVKMLVQMLEDQDADIRRLAMTTLNSAAHHKPDLILPNLGELVGRVLEETVIKKELIREVKLGPFTHLVDDGLEVRKSAYDTLYAILEVAFTRINSKRFYDRVIAGLSDDNDIRSLCNLMVTKLVLLDSNEIDRRLDAIAEVYKTVLSTKLKDTAVKQEVEKQEEANKGVLRVTVLLGDKMRAGTADGVGAAAGRGKVGGGGAGGGGSAHPVWVAYWDWVNKEFQKQLRSMRDETKELQGSM